MDRDLLGDRRWHSPPASSSCFKSARSVSSRGILERICIRYPLGEMHQIQVVRREMIKNGKPQPGISATRHSSFRIVLLSLNVFLLPLLETSTLLSKASLSLSPSPRPPPPFPAFIICLCRYKDCLHVVSGLLVTLLDSELFTARLGGNLLSFKLCHGSHEEASHSGSLTLPS